MPFLRFSQLSSEGICPPVSSKAFGDHFEDGISRHRSKGPFERPSPRTSSPQPSIPSIAAAPGAKIESLAILSVPLCETRKTKGLHLDQPGGLSIQDPSIRIRAAVCAKDRCKHSLRCASANSRNRRLGTCRCSGMRGEMSPVLHPPLRTRPRKIVGRQNKLVFGTGQTIGRNSPSRQFPGNAGRFPRPPREAVCSARRRPETS
jgi:hypothetical protein